jgi:hypothetical protein
LKTCTNIPACQTYFTIAHTPTLSANLAAQQQEPTGCADKSCRRRAQKGQNVFVCGANKTKKGKFCRPLEHGYDRKIIQQICLDFWSDVKKAAALSATTAACVLSIFRRATLCCLEFIRRLKCETRRSNSARLAAQEFRQCRDKFFASQLQQECELSNSSSRIKRASAEMGLINYSFWLN